LGPSEVSLLFCIGGAVSIQQNHVAIDDSHATATAGKLELQPDEVKLIFQSLVFNYDFFE
jgi:hypothetical protein